MFGLFGSAKSTTKVIDKVWISTQAKWNACAAMARVNADCVFVAWFQNTYDRVKELIGDESRVFLAEKLDLPTAQKRLVVFVEHYPLSQPEQRLFDSLNLKEIPVLSALDEPLFMHFGGERTIELMKKLGVPEEEAIGHSLITSSIKSAQRKLEQKVRMEKKADSVEDWFQLNSGEEI